MLKHDKILKVQSVSVPEQFWPGTDWPHPEAMTYGQRIALGKWQKEIEGQLTGELKKFKDILAIMAPHHKPRIDTREVKYVEGVLEQFKYWVEVENKLLHVDPDKLEKQAGVEELTKKLQELGVIEALSDKFKKCPDEVLQWSYGTVFGMLYADKEKSVYRKKYQKLSQKEAEKEAKSKSKRRR